MKFLISISILLLGFMGFATLMVTLDAQRLLSKVDVLESENVKLTDDLIKEREKNRVRGCELLQLKLNLAGQEMYAKKEACLKEAKRNVGKIEDCNSVHESTLQQRISEINGEFGNLEC